MFSNELAHKLIKLPKKIEGGTLTIDLLDEKTRLILNNIDEPEYSFLFEVTSHRKITFKIDFFKEFSI